MNIETKIKLACAAFVAYAFLYLIFSFKSPVFAALFWLNIYGIAYFCLSELAKRLSISTDFIIVLSKSTLISIGLAQIYDCFNPISHNYFACYFIGLTAFITSLAWHYRLRKRK